MDVIFWLDKPPFACKGVFDAFANLWTEGNVYFACLKNVSGIQTVINANYSANVTKAKTIIFENSEIDPFAFAENHLQDIHIFNGYKSNTKDILLFLSKKQMESKIIIWGEEPRVSKKYRHIPAFLKILKKNEYSFYSSISDAFLVIGKQGIRDYAKLGWPKDKMFPFFYSSVDCSVPNSKLAPSNPIQFLYLGRFDYKDKGVDTIFKALKRIRSKDFTFTFAGGYGEKTEEIKKRIRLDERTILSGPVPIEECYSYFQNFDVYVAPAKADSWNCPVCTALLSGVPVIASDRCGNDFLIDNGYNGFTFRAGNSRKLAALMKSFISGYIDIPEMKRNAQKSGELIKPNRLALYLLNIIQFLYFGLKERPNIDMTREENA